MRAVPAQGHLVDAHGRAARLGSHLRGQVVGQERIAQSTTGQVLGQHRQAQLQGEVRVRGGTRRAGTVR